MARCACVVTPRTRNRLKLVGIGVLAALPVIASYLLYWYWTPDQHTNYGTLLEPQPLPGITLRALDGEPFDLTKLHGRWIMLATDGGKCGPRCQEKLWKMRQVRLAQGKEMNRLERVWLIDDGAKPDPAVLQAHTGLWVALGTEQAIAAALPAERSSREHIYLIDPLGNLMLRFPRDAEPKPMIRDLVRLLKYSRSG
jgi:cytochrome oxidase Cu insertion factor (SCO1/SenC/PrrC family)